MVENPKLYHLSHIDLDGYGCQYLTTNAFEKIRCYNANYGPEVMARIEEIAKAIEDERNGANALILITDLNLTTKECNKTQKIADKLGASLQLLDHHKTGEESAKSFEWYFLDTQRSATKITYDWLKKEYGFDADGKFAKIVEAINAIDIWVEDSEFFEYGKVMLGMISGAREIGRILFPDQDRAFKLSMIQAAHEILEESEAHIVLDDRLHSIKKTFFKGETNNTKDNLVAHYIAKLLTKHKDRLLIRYKEYKGILGYSIGSSSLIGNAVLSLNPDIDFYMDVGSRGNISLRSSDRVDVSKIAATIGDGGGHPNAAGGKIEGFKDSFVYDEIREFVQAHIDAKLSEATQS